MKKNKNLLSKFRKKSEISTEIGGIFGKYADEMDLKEAKNLGLPPFRKSKVWYDIQSGGRSRGGRAFEK